MMEAMISNTSGMLISVGKTEYLTITDRPETTIKSKVTEMIIKLFEGKKRVNAIDWGTIKSREKKTTTFIL